MAWPVRAASQAELPAELPDRRHHKRIGGPEQQDLAVKLHGCKPLHNLAGLDPACRQSDYDEVGQLLLEHRGKFTCVSAFASDKSELFKGLTQECANVLFGVGDADSGVTFRRPNVVSLDVSSNPCLSMTHSPVLEGAAFNSTFVVHCGAVLRPRELTRGSLNLDND
jgi:hypothetical protein